MVIQSIKRVGMFAALGAMAFAASESKVEPAATVEIAKGSATFVASTNVPAVVIKGKTSSVEGRVSLQRGANGIQLEQIKARVPVATILTGMGMRDEHMRKYIFTTPEGNVPDLEFEGAATACSGHGQEAVCQVSGTLSIRGVSQPFAMPMKIRADGSGYKAIADGVVKLSTYSIDRPTQFGVKTADDIQLHFELASKPAPTTLAAAGGPK